MADENQETKKSKPLTFAGRYTLYSTWVVCTASTPHSAHKENEKRVLLSMCFVLIRINCSCASA